MDAFLPEENGLNCGHKPRTLNGIGPVKKHNIRAIEKVPNPTKICNLDLNFKSSKVRLPKINNFWGSLPASRLHFEFTSLSSGSKPLSRLPKYRHQEDNKMENASPTQISPRKVNSPASEENETCPKAKSKIRL